MHFGFDVLLPGAPVRRQSVLPRNMDPWGHPLHPSADAAVRKCRSITPQCGDNFGEPIHPDSVPFVVSENFYQSEGGALYRGHLGVQLWTANPHPDGRLGCVWFR